jgi:glycosyltransferase involved in cell wall biosynthesis
MRALILHNEAVHFGGAEKVLAYYLAGALATGLEVAVAVVKGSRTAQAMPTGVPIFDLPDNQSFSPRGFAQQVQAVRRISRVFPFTLLHGWAARDWELASVAAILCGCPVLGTLHDHPEAAFISPQRRRLMRWCARLGLNKIVCVSEAVRQACLSVGYPEGKLAVVRNGLPELGIPRLPGKVERLRLGFLGAFCERKGLRTLFAILAELGASCLRWECRIAGTAQDTAGEQLLKSLKAEYGSAAWWPQVSWAGWIQYPGDFLAGIDLLLVPSSEFDPFPTVLLEAGMAGIPVVAARVGGVSEIVENGQTGWLFSPGDALEAARLVTSAAQACALPAAGHEARARIRREFAIEGMVANYRDLYSRA